MFIKKAITVLALSSSLWAGGVITANAAVQHPNEGGTWTYGFWDFHARSYYTNDHRCHGSTAANDWGEVRSVDTAAGHRSTAEKFGTPWTHNRYYYRVC